MASLLLIGPSAFNIEIVIEVSRRYPRPSGGASRERREASALARSDDVDRLIELRNVELVDDPVGLGIEQRANHLQPANEMPLVDPQLNGQRLCGPSRLRRAGANLVGIDSALDE